MVIFGVSIVKNESDIIEAWVRHHLQFFDAMHVIDNDSIDSTREILDRLATEAPVLRVSSDASVGHLQERILTRTINDLVDTENFDFVFPLDADEFVRCEDRAMLEAALDAIPVGHYGKIPWVTYVPTPQDDWSQANPLRRIVHRQALEPKQFFKMAIPYATAALPGFRLRPGNHDAAAGGQLLPDFVVPRITLAHFPVRSPQQFASKVLIGDWSLSLKSGRAGDEGAHWQRFANQVTDRIDISPEDLQSAAASYVATRSPNLVHDPVPQSEDCALEWPDLVKVDLTDRVVKFASTHFRRLAHTALRNEYMAIGKTRWGLIGYQVADTVIGRSIELYGEWAAEEIRLLCPLLQPGDVVIDVGANIGTHTVAFAAAVGPSGTVHAFEPQRLTFQLLCANAALNGLTNVQGYLQGVGAAAGATRVPVPDLRRGGNFGNFSLAEAREGELVPVVTLDSLKLTRVKLLKIDVEGMEADVLSGAKDLIATARPAIFVENNIPEKSTRLIQLLLDLGYRCWWHLASYYNPGNFYANPDNIFATVDRPEVNMLCFPSEVNVATEGLLPVTGPEDTWQSALARSEKT